MATIGSGVANLTDVLAELAPDGSQLETAEVLRQVNPVLEEMTWMEGNLLTGHRDSVRTALPTPSFRAINSGVPITKGATTQIEETCALLEDFSQADRELAILSGNVERFRLNQAKPHMQGMSHKLAETLFYGNAQAGDPKSFTGLAPRFNSLSGPTKGQIIDAGGTGTGLRSVYLIGWSDQTVTGLYPKNSIGGLQHEDATNASGSGGDGIPPAAVLQDSNGNNFMGYRDHWTWRCGLMVKDYRFVVRIANIDIDLLTKDQSTGADLQDLLVQATETIESLEGVRAAFYAPRVISAFLRRQLLNEKNAFMSWMDMGGKRIMGFGEVPFRRTDALNVEETEVV